MTFRSTACLLYHFAAALSRGFAKLFSSFFGPSTELVVLSDSFVSIPLSITLVNSFFEVFHVLYSFLIRITILKLILHYYISEKTVTFLPFLT